MKLIIDIHNRDYNAVKNGLIPFAILDAIKNDNLDSWIKGNVNSIINKAVDKSVQQRITDRLIGRYFSHMDVSVKILPIMDIENEEGEQE